MTALTQKRNTEIFAFIVALVFNLLSGKVLLINRKDNRQKWLLFKKIANFTCKLLQNYKQLQREMFKILLKHVWDH